MDKSKISGVSEQAIRDTLDEVLSWLRQRGRHEVADELAFAWGHQEPGHVCFIRDGQCVRCGARE